jgi:hypothetical protein
VAFTNAGAGVETLKFDAAASSSPTLIYGGTISGFATTSDVIDFTGLAFQGTSNPLHAALSGGNTIITVTEGVDQVSFKLAGNHLGDTFMVSQDSGTGTQIVDPPALTRSGHSRMPLFGDAGVGSDDTPTHHGSLTSPYFEDGAHSAPTKNVDSAFLVKIDSTSDQIHMAEGATATPASGDDFKQTAAGSSQSGLVGVHDDHFTFISDADANEGTHTGFDAEQHVGDLEHASGQQRSSHDLHAIITPVVHTDTLQHSDAITSQPLDTQLHQMVQAAHGLLH